MARDTGRREALAFFEGPLKEFLLSNQNDETIDEHAKLLEAVNPDYKWQRLRRCYADELRTLAEQHDKCRLLRSRSEKARDFTVPDDTFEWVFLHALETLRWLKLSGTATDEALESILKGFRSASSLEPYYLIEGVTIIGLNVTEPVIFGPWTVRHLTESEMLHATGRATKEKTLPVAVVRKRKADVDGYCYFPRIPRASLRPVVTFLKVIMQWKVQISGFFSIGDGWLPQIYCRSGPPHNYSRVNGWYYAEKTELDSEAATKIKKLWPRFAKAERDPRFRIACYRYSAGHDRAEKEDEFIDYWIALEALYGESNGITSTLSSKMAVALRSEVEVRKKFKGVVANAYKMRNRIVHGDEADQRHLEYGRVRGWLEASLKLFAERPELLPQLDGLLLTGGFDKSGH